MANEVGERISSAVERANRAGRPAIAAFLTAGFPNRGHFAGLLAAAFDDLIQAVMVMVMFGLPAAILFVFIPETHGVEVEAD